MLFPSQNPSNRLHEEVAAIRMLLDLLQQEQNCLAELNIDGLAKLTEEKAKTILCISELTQHRYNMLAEAGFDAGESGMEAWLQSPAATSIARQGWDDLRQLARSAKEVNRTNGLMIGQQITRNQATLNVLQGHQQNNSFYGPNGQSTAKTTSRGLAIG